MAILVTGAAGFIGHALCKRLLANFKDDIVGVDNLNDYYDVSLKEARLSDLRSSTGFVFVKGDISDRPFVETLFAQWNFTVVINLAAQAGVRYSISQPDVYVSSNVLGFYNVLEACRRHMPRLLLYASSSSVYGANSKIPFSTDDQVDCPVSLYAATKKTNELFAYAYSKLYGIPTVGLRFFTVYGPMGRPDMAYFSFTNKLIRGQTIDVFNYGNCSRDFTFIDDIIEGVFRIVKAAIDGTQSLGRFVDRVPYNVYNIGNGHPENLLSFIQILCEELIRVGVLPKDYDYRSHVRMLPMQQGDVPNTYADVTGLEKDYGYKPSTPLRQGLRAFAEWYASFYGTQQSDKLPPVSP